MIKTPNEFNRLLKLLIWSDQLGATTIEDPYAISGRDMRLSYVLHVILGYTYITHIEGEKYNQDKHVHLKIPRSLDYYRIKPNDITNNYYIVHNQTKYGFSLRHILNKLTDNKINIYSETGQIYWYILINDFATEQLTLTVSAQYTHSLTIPSYELLDIYQHNPQHLEIIIRIRHALIALGLLPRIFMVPKYPPTIRFIVPTTLQILQANEINIAHCKYHETLTLIEFISQLFQSTDLKSHQPTQTSRILPCIYAAIFRVSGVILPIPVNIPHQGQPCSIEYLLQDIHFDRIRVIQAAQNEILTLQHHTPRVNDPCEYTRDHATNPFTTEKIINPDTEFPTWFKQVPPGTQVVTQPAHILPLANLPVTFKPNFKNPQRLNDNSAQTQKGH